MAKKANMIFVSGVPDYVRVGDRVFMQVCLMESEEFISSAEVTVAVEDYSVAYIMEKPDMSEISIPGVAMDDPELRQSYEDLYEFVPTSVSTQETDKGGQAVFMIDFKTIGVTRFFVNWEDRGEVRTEEIKVVVFQSGATLVQNRESLTGAGEFNPEEDRITDQLMGVPMPVNTEEEDDIEIITLTDMIQDIPEGMDDEEYAESQEVLHADVDAPEELFFGGEGVIRVKIRNAWHGMLGEEVELQSLTPNVNVFSSSRHSDSESVIYDKTDKDGFVEFRISHIGSEAEKARMIIRWDMWDSEDKKPKSTEVLISIHARQLFLTVDTPVEAEVGSRVQIKLNVHELGKPIEGIPVTISSDSEDVAFFLITRDSRAVVESDSAISDNEGNVIFQMRHRGKKSGAVKYSIQWNRDGVTETVHGSTIQFFKPEETVETRQEDVMSQNTDDKKKAKKTDSKKKDEKKKPDPKKKDEKKKSHVWVYLLLGGLLVIIVVGTWYAWNQGMFDPKPSAYVVTPDVPDKPEIHAAKGEETKDTELSAPTETEGKEELVLTVPETEEGESEPSGEDVPPSDEEPPGEDEEPAAVVPSDAFTYDVTTETVLVYSDSLGKSLKQGKVNKIKLNKAKKEVEDLERKLKKSKDVNFSLVASSDSLEAEIEAMKQEIDGLQSGEPNLALIKVDKIECTGKYEVIKCKKGRIIMKEGMPTKCKGGEAIGVKIPKCKVYLSTIDSK